MQALLAGLPLLVVLAAMALLRWRAALAGAAGLGVALAVIWGMGRFDGTLLAGAAFEAVSSTATILWIILPALAIYELQSRVGAFDRFQQSLAQISNDRAVQALLVAWFFGLFMEGAAGFGSPVALAAPLLVGLGFAPVRAVALALLGHAGGVSFGAVGTPALAQITLLELPAAAFAGQTMLLHLVPMILLALSVMRLANGGRLAWGQVRLALLAASCFVLPATMLAWWTGPELPTLGGALIGGSIFVALIRRRGTQIRTAQWQLTDLSPYIVILALVLSTRLVEPVQARLSGLWLGWDWNDYSGGLAPLYHPGTLLALGFVLAASLTGRSAALGPAITAAMLRLAPVALALCIMLALARLMVHGGLIAEAAEAAAGAGPFWPVFAPFIGALGTFVSGSATASNILFSEFQAATARSLDLPLMLMAAAQGVGAAIGNAIAPHNIIAGTAMVGLTGRDGEVLRHTLVPVLAYALCAGGILAMLAHLGM